MYNSIEEITVRRTNWVKANRENGFEDGIKNLLTELYPDNAHFIYELLQNAEDAGAHEVHFALTEDALTFSHDGQRLFDLKDIDSITSIGVSTKREDHTRIGKFGVGFKAVFAYTNTPEVHSGKYHFCIEDLVVPKKVSSANITHKSNNITTFTIPFNHAIKNKFQAVKEVRQGLILLNASSLLFLTNIHTINYSLPDGFEGIIKRIDCNDGHITIEAPNIQILNNIESTSVQKTHWLRYQKRVAVSEQGQSTSCQVAIAFSLQENFKDNKSIGWKIVPLERGQVFIFFPAEKETSQLRFHIHAPFASTVARDSVRSCDGNIQLRDYISELIVQSLPDIKRRGLLTVNFLKALPNPKDNLSHYYEPIRKALVEAFQEKAFTPTLNKKHAPAKKLYQGNAELSKLFNDKDLALFTNKKTPLWAARAQQKNDDDDRFLNSLEITDWDFASFIVKIYEKNETKNFFENWITEKKDSWLMLFYAITEEFLSGFSYVHHKRYESLGLLSSNIIRVMTPNGTITHVSGQNAYFTPKDKMLTNNNFNFVLPSSYMQKKKEKNNRAYSFLQKMGVQEFNESIIIEGLVKKQAQYPIQEMTSHLSDIVKFIAFWKETKNITPFSDEQFILSVSTDGGLTYSKPSELYLDTPYYKTGMSEVTDIHDFTPVWDGYKENLVEQQLEDFTLFLQALSINASLQVVDSPIFLNPFWTSVLLKNRYGTRPNSYTIAKDYSIKDIDIYTSKKTITTSRLLWMTIIHAGSEVKFASYKPNASYTLRQVDSLLVHTLKKTAWIPNKDGKFRKPKNISREELHPDFIYDDSNGLLTAINFGLEAQKQSAEYENSNAQAVNLGFESKEMADKAAILVGILGEEGLDRLIAKHQPSKSTPFPERPVRNPERRQDRKSEQMQDAQAKKYEQRKRNVRVSAPVPKEKDTYLIENYTNEEGELVCQICKSEMPFKKRNNEYYFERIEIFSKDYLKNEDSTPYLALCPLCAAKYKEFVKKNYGQLDKIFGAIKEHDNHEIPILLDDGKEATIRFVEAHYIDVQTVIQNEK